MNIFTVWRILGFKLVIWFDTALGALKFEIKIISIINSERKITYRNSYLYLSTEWIAENT